MTGLRRGLLLLAVLAAVGLIVVALRPTGRQLVPPAELARLADQNQARFHVDRALILAVVENESGGDAHARSSAGALGLMQLLPATADELARRHHLSADLYDPAANMALGSAYLRELGDRFRNQPDLVIAAYHAGPSRVEGWQRAHPDRSISQLIDQSAGPQTRAYVANVEASWRRFRDEQQRTAQLPSEPRR
ncbi:MAG: lytic transglycosylase domain-containing protein [Planctomycetota bacterium]